MNLFNIKVPKDSISMVFDTFNGAENYNTSLYLYKSKIILKEPDNKYSAKLEIDLDQDLKKNKLVSDFKLDNFNIGCTIVHLKEGEK